MTALIYPDLPKLAVSVRQPWTFAIVHLGKDIENRNWSHSYRGPIAIHASRSVGTKAEYREAKEDVSGILSWSSDDRLQKWQNALDNDVLLIRGGIIGTAEVVACTETSESDWFFGRYGFVLQNAQPVEFIPVKGELGFFDWRKNLLPDQS